MLSGKKILLGITASIAAYKSIILLRLLVKEGAEVKVIITPSARKFISPVILSTFSSHKVYCEFVENDQWKNHVELGNWADLFLIAPLSCNTLAKMANGICDNFFLATYLSAKCKIIICPAMDEDMLMHPATKNNLQTLASFGYEIIEPKIGALASGIFGKGRMAEPEEIILFLQEIDTRKTTFLNKKVLITAGPTKEYIDPVRYISNESSGKMGFALANAFYEAGAEVVLIAGPVSIHLPNKNIQIISVTSAFEMYEAVLKEQASADYLILNAAVADYTPLKTSNEKIKKENSELSITLIKTIDILKELGNLKQHNQVLVGFALETNDFIQNAEKKRVEKNADYIILNKLDALNPCFNSEFNEVTIIGKEGDFIEFPKQSKKGIAESIVSYLGKK